MVPAASFISHFWEHQLVDHGRQYLFLVLVGFIGSFGFIRLSARLMRSPRVPWWPGSVVSDSGVHLHHLVWGIGAMIGAGVVSFALIDTGFWYELSAVVFGIGIGLTIDEFALWVYLDDVYWAKEGRSSIDATAIAAAAMGLVLLGFRPFDVKTGTAADAAVSVVGALLLFAFVALCFAKQRLVHGLIGFFFPPIALYGAARIGKPGSPWARRFYGERSPAKEAKARERFPPGRRTERFKERFRDLVGGETGEAYEARLAEHAATEEAAATVRRRAERLAAGESKAPRP